MTNEVTRRIFLSGTAGAISAASLMPSDDEMGPDESLSLEQLAHALHETVGRYSDRNAQFFPDQKYSQYHGHSLNFAMENLRFYSEDEIQHLLKPLFDSGAS